MEVKLKFFNGPQRASVRITKHRKYVVGSASETQLRLSPGNSSVSRRHFAIEVQPFGCSIIDLGSTNGTLVNGRKVANAELHDGDMIQAGTVQIQVSVRGTWRRPAAGEILELEQVVAERTDRCSRESPAFIRANL